MPNFGNPTPNVVFNPLGQAQPVKNGYAVITPSPNTKQDLAPVCSGVNVPSAGAYGALWNSRLIASGETSVVTR
jgi:hypothetical protein